MFILRINAVLPEAKIKTKKKDPCRGLLKTTESYIIFYHI
ncbi:Uncharacterised protein [Salmonella enterica subsp. enterica serovar Typhi]|nr:Uncharacterised protein [Salmonella enterica subsp. enterica serovar Typhi]CHR18054.1 Uncharacterised protein [Salmonella enterica subsp. enterica serovar Typhi]SLS02714.1 Uncharacterised protein [Klebsiella pneumoniae]SVW61252.1 Uncharacterised protein [Klebsiella pneumoniae]